VIGPLVSVENNTRSSAGHRFCLFELPRVVPKSLSRGGCRSPSTPMGIRELMMADAWDWSLVPCPSVAHASEADLFAATAFPVFSVSMKLHDFGGSFRRRKFWD